MSPFDPRLLRRVDVLKRDVIQRCSVLRVGTASGAHDFFGQEKSLFLSMRMKNVAYCNCLLSESFTVKKGKK